MIVPKHRELRVKDIQNAPYNPPGRVEGQGIRELADSMSRIGLVYPVLVDEANVLIEGHRRLAAAKLLGWETVKAMVMPSEQRDQIYAGVNSTAKRMMGRDALGIWLMRPAAVSPKQSKRFNAMRASVGEALVKRIHADGLSPRVWETAKAICRYTETDDVVKVTTWLLDHAVIGQVMKALEAKEDPRVFLNAIRADRPIKFKLQVD